mgnify:CR=1 FL=1
MSNVETFSFYLLFLNVQELLSRGPARKRPGDAVTSRARTTEVWLHDQHAAYPRRSTSAPIYRSALTRRGADRDPRRSSGGHPELRPLGAGPLAHRRRNSLINRL